MNIPFSDSLADLSNHSVVASKADFTDARYRVHLQRHTCFPSIVLIIHAFQNLAGSVAYFRYGNQ